MSGPSIFAFLCWFKLSGTHVDLTYILHLGMLYYISIILYKSSPLPVTSTLQLIVIIVPMCLSACKHCQVAFIVSGSYLLCNVINLGQQKRVFYWFLCSSHKCITMNGPWDILLLTWWGDLHTTPALECPPSRFCQFISPPSVKTILAFQWHLVWAIISPCF